MSLAVTNAQFELLVLHFLLFECGLLTSLFWFEFLICRTYRKQQIINAHPELKLFVGLDVDPVAHEKAQARINSVLHCDSSGPASDLNVYTMLKNFRHIKSAISEIGEEHLCHGVDGILMDLGMSSMQVNFLNFYH